MYYYIAYGMISFIAASIIVKIWPGNFIPSSDEDFPPLIPFVFTMGIWPIVVAFWILYGPFKLLNDWVKLLSR